MAGIKETKINVSGNIGDVEKATAQILDRIFEKLSTHGIVKSDGPARLFFPNGIELIFAQVTVSPTTGINIEVKIAGEKGIKDNEPSKPSLAKLSPDGSPVIRKLYPAQVPLAYAGPVMIIGENFDDGSFALFDGNVPRILKQSSKQLRVLVDSEITGTVGIKTVIVHTSGGDESNEATFEVKEGIPGPSTAQ